MVVVVLLAGAGCDSSDNMDAGVPDMGSPDAASPDASLVDGPSPDSAATDTRGPDMKPAKDVGSFWGQDLSAPEAGACAGGFARAFGMPNQYDDITTAMDSAGDAIMGMDFVNSGGKVGGLSLLSQGKSDFVLAKLDRCGRYRWVRAVGGKSWDNVDFLGADKQGNIYVVGNTADTAKFGKFTVKGGAKGSLFVAKVSPAGQFIWVSTFGPYETTVSSSSGSCWNYFNDMAVDAAGNVHLVGVICGPLNAGGAILYPAGIFDLLVVKLDAKGKVTWATSAGSGWQDGAGGIVVDSNGNIFIAGYFGDYNLKYCGGARTIKLGKVTVKSEGGCADALVAAMTPKGEWVWGVAAGGSRSDGAGYILLHDNGDLFIAGSHGSYYVTSGQGSAPTFGGAPVTGTSKKGAFLARLSTAGKFKWANIDMGIAGCLSKGPDKSILMGGGPGNAAATRMSPAGVPLKAYTPMGATMLGGYQVSYTKLTGAVLSGVFMGTGTFGGETLTTLGSGTSAVDAYLWWIPPAKL